MEGTRAPTHLRAGTRAVVHVLGRSRRLRRLRIRDRLAAGLVSTLLHLRGRARVQHTIHTQGTLLLGGPDGLSPISVTSADAGMSTYGLDDSPPSTTSADSESLP